MGHGVGNSENLTARPQDRRTARLISPQQRNPDANHTLMLLIAGTGVFHLQEGGAGQFGTLTAVLESLLIDRAVVQRADL